MNIANVREAARLALAGLRKRARKMKPRLAIGKPLALCPGWRQAWFESAIGAVRKPLPTGVGAGCASGRLVEVVPTRQLWRAEWKRQAKAIGEWRDREFSWKQFIKAHGV